MKAELAVVALAGMLASGGAMADTQYDGNELLRQCQQYIKLIDSEKNYNLVDAGFCGGFVQGVHGTVAFLSDDLVKEAKFCSPNGVTNNQLVRIVVKFLKDNPKQLNLNRTGLVWAAFQDAYPCK